MSVETITLGTLYRATRSSGDPVLQINGSGTVNVYASYLEPTSSPVTNDMALMKSGSETAVSGVILLETVPTYLYIVQASATVGVVTLAGVSLEAV